MGEIPPLLFLAHNAAARTDARISNGVDIKEATLTTEMRLHLHREENNNALALVSAKNHTYLPAPAPRLWHLICTLEVDLYATISGERTLLSTVSFDCVLVLTVQSSAHADTMQPLGVFCTGRMSVLRQLTEAARSTYKLQKNGQFLGFETDEFNALVNDVKDKYKLLNQTLVSDIEKEMRGLRGSSVEFVNTSPAMNQEKASEIVSAAVKACEPFHLRSAQ